MVISSTTNSRVSQLRIRATGYDQNAISKSQEYMHTEEKKQPNFSQESAYEFKCQ